MTNMNQNSGALSWDSQITQESSFNLLPEGEYDFAVEKMERGQFQPSQRSKIDVACPQAELTVKLFSSEHGEANVFENLILHTATEWKISEFFISIGQKRKGEPFVPNWSQVPGARGRAKVEVNEYTNNKGEKRTNNRIVEFLPPQTNAQQTQPAQTQQPANNPGFQF